MLFLQYNAIYSLLYVQADRLNYGCKPNKITGVIYVIITFVKRRFYMKDRILSFLQKENKSYAQFAEEIGVQPSGISHILSGRNNPSLDFVLKMLQKYQSLSAEWLLFGTGNMYKSISQPTLFDSVFKDDKHDNSGPSPVSTIREQEQADNAQPESKTEQRLPEAAFRKSGSKKIISVVFLYDDKTFAEFFPE